MASLTRWVLAHKRIVVIFWVVLTLIGMASSGSASKALKQKFSVPGKEGWVTNQQIGRDFHGTGGNGYAFLKLYRRTNDAVWLERARAFAMTSIAQCREARAELGRGRYTLWTGDIGLAVYLWDCLTGVPRFPTVDIF